MSGENLATADLSGPTLVIGESLIDLVHRTDGSTQEHVGGSPANVAVGLARLGYQIQLATHVGKDARGATIVSHLVKEGISLTEGSVGGRPTSLATSTLDAAGAAAYSFDLSWDLAALAPLEGLAHVHTGSIAATLEPGASAVLSMVQSARPNATISYDPNVRPSLMGDPHEVRAKVEALVGLSDVVKASEEDIAWLYAGVPIPDILRLWGQLGPALTVVTRGGEGVVVRLSITGELAAMATPVVEVADTVGAGDSFMAGLLSGLLDARLLGGPQGRERLRSAALADVRPAVERALACAAITVSRAGANPPRLAELGGAERGGS
ncbi:MAG: carbohydrate kinase [Actinomycetota bacterium]